jgi:hypothetical protein
LRGIPVEASPDWWLVILEMANYDPLRAQQIEQELSMDWYRRYVAYKSEAGALIREKKHKAKR